MQLTVGSGRAYSAGFSPSHNIYLCETWQQEQDKPQARSQRPPVAHWKHRCVICFVRASLDAVTQYSNIMMEKQQKMDSDREEPVSSGSLDWEKLVPASPSSQSREQRPSGPAASPRPHLLRAEKQHFIKALLKSLGYQESAKCFERECRGAEGDKNPEEASNRKKVGSHKKREPGEDCFKQLVQGSQSYEEMLQAFEVIYGSHGQAGEAALAMQRIALNADFQRRVKSLFGARREAVVPKHRSIEILLEGKEVKFIDVSEEEKLCLLDSEDFLHVVSARGESKPLRVEEGREVVYLKWVNRTTIFVVGGSGTVTVFSVEGEGGVRLRESIPLKMPRIRRINLHILKYPERPDKEYVRILLKNENAEFIACQIVVHRSAVKFTGGTLFETRHNFKAFNVIRVPRALDRQPGSRELAETEHYYGLADNGKSIIKFDTIVKKEGVLWTSSRKIDAMTNSQCRCFLVLLLVDCRQRRRQPREVESRRARRQVLFRYEFVRMNGHGCVLERVPLDLQSPLLPEGLYSVGLSRMRVMDPDWLVCFDWQDSIVYASTRSGKILHVQDMQEDVQVIGVGPSNCLVCSAQEKLLVVSVREGEKRRLILERRPQARDRESLILRLTRNGIPETLLQLLQELRNNQVEIIES